MVSATFHVWGLSSTGLAWMSRGCHWDSRLRSVKTRLFVVVFPSILYTAYSNLDLDLMQLDDDRVWNMLPGHFLWGHYITTGCMLYWWKVTHFVIFNVSCYDFCLIMNRCWKSSEFSVSLQQWKAKATILFACIFFLLLFWQIYRQSKFEVEAFSFLFWKKENSVPLDLGVRFPLYH